MVYVNIYRVQYTEMVTATTKSGMVCMFFNFGNGICVFPVLRQITISMNYANVLLSVYVWYYYVCMHGRVRDCICVCGKSFNADSVTQLNNLDVSACSTL